MLRVEIAGIEHRRAALEVLLQDLTPLVREQQVAESLDAAANGDVSLDGLLLARMDGKPIGAVLFVMQPDGCGFVWPPVVARGVEAALVENVADELLQAVCRGLDAADAWLGQSLLDLDSALDIQRLQRNGFEFLADLTYLRRPLDGTRVTGQESRHEQITVVTTHHSPLTTHLQVDTVDPVRDAERLAAVIERTYSGSADCPPLNGLRSGMEAVAGHRLTGIPLAEGWMIFRDATGDVGVLLLADQPEQDAWELVYMGVAPEARGRGYGRFIVETALQQAAKSGRRDLLLAVDERNRFAGTVYEAAGFQLLDRKRVLGRRPLSRSGK